MRLSIDLKRVSLITLVCFVTATIPRFVPSFDFFLPPLIFSVAVPLTNIDKITTTKIHYAFILSAILILILFLTSVVIGMALERFLGQYSIFVMCLSSGLLTLLINSFILQIENIKRGLVITGLLALTIPPLTMFLKGLGSSAIDFFGDPYLFFIIWQTVIGLSIGLSIRTRTSSTTKVIEG